MRIPLQSLQRKSRQAGFSLIEVMISMIVVTVGLVGMLSVFAFATASTQAAQEDMIAKELASEAMESIFTARETAQVTWDQIQNTGTGNTPDGIFVTGFQDIHQSGNNGIYGTSDDADAPARQLQLVGRDGSHYSQFESYQLQTQDRDCVGIGNEFASSRHHYHQVHRVSETRSQTLCRDCVHFAVQIGITMPKKFLRSEKGFSLMETVVAMGIGFGMLAAAVQLYTQSLNATFRVSLRAEMQQDVRAAENILIRDISLAGAGLPPGGVALAKGGAKNPIYGCDQAKCYLGGSPASGLAFPGSSTPYMYWLIPGAAVGPTINASVGATDAVTVVQGDTAFPWTDYVMTLNSSGTTGTVTLW